MDTLQMLLDSIIRNPTVNPHDLLISSAFHDALEENGFEDHIFRITSSCGLRLNLIFPGDFFLGDQSKKDLVRLTDCFFMGETTVTQSQYEYVTGSNPSAFRQGGRNEASVSGMNTSDFPVECVSWHDALAFCKKLTEIDRQKGIIPEDWEYTLPTEAEWEYCCRAGTTTLYNTGDTLSPEQANTYESGLQRTCATKSYAPNAWGLYEMHGNVWEWCLDSYT